LVPLKIVSKVSRFKPALNLNRVLADLNRGSNSLNSILGYLKFCNIFAYFKWHGHGLVKKGTFFSFLGYLFSYMDLLGLVFIYLFIY